MNLNHDDKLRLWKALAAYIDECEALAKDADDPELADYYRTEIEECRTLRRELGVRA